MKLRNYDGVSVIRLGRAPTSGDYGRIPTLWVDETNKDAYMLVHVADDGTTQWDKFASVTYVDNTIATVSGNINSFLEMTDTPNSYTNNSLLYVTSSGIEYTSPDITWDGTSLDITGTANLDYDKLDTEGTAFDGSRLVYTLNPQGPSSMNSTGFYVKMETERTVCSGIYTMRGAQIFADHNGEGNIGDIIALELISSSNFENGSLDSIIGLRSRALACGKNWEDGGNLSNPVLVPKAYGITSQVRYRFDGAVDTGYGIYIYTPENVFGMGDYINTAYGLYIEDHSTSATAVNNDSHAIYVEGGKSYFGGNITTSGYLGVGLQSPQAKFHLYGDANIIGDTSFLMGDGTFYSRSVYGGVIHSKGTYSISIGLSHSIGSDNCAILGGWNNTIDAPIEPASHSVIVSGMFNSITSSGSGAFDNNLGRDFIGSGQNNTVNIYCVGDNTGRGIIVGGDYNTVTGDHGIVVGGSYNTVTGDYGVIPGGNYNEVSGLFGFAAGLKAKAKHQGSFVWSDFTPGTDFKSITNDEFAVRASGGIRLVGDVTTSGVFNMPSNPPATAGAAGTRGDIAWDDSYFYVCTADNTWKRSSLSSW